MSRLTWLRISTIYTDVELRLP